MCKVDTGGLYTMAIYNNITELIGKTSLLALNNIKKELNLEADIYVKLEAFNPAGSVKDRIAFAMFKTAQESGLIKPGTVIVEATSGNTGIGLASVGAAMGHEVILTMPETMSVERRNLLKAYGAQLVLTEGALGMKGAIAKAKEIADSLEDAFIPSQFENEANVMIHYTTTGPEVLEDTEGNIDFFVSGVGTGGTITGAGKFLKEHVKNISIVAVEPVDSPVLSGGQPGPHKIQGIGAGFIPHILDTKIYDEIVKVTNEEAFEKGRLMAQREGFLVGISSGAAIHAAIELAKRPENKGKRIVALLPDTGERYLSTPLFSE